jgi:hypothetical protein
VPVIVDKARREDAAADAQLHDDAEDEAWLDAVLSGYEDIDLSEDDRPRQVSSSSGSSSLAGKQQRQVSSSSSHPCMLRRLMHRLVELWRGQ